MTPDSARDPLAEHGFGRVFAVWCDFENSRMKLDAKQKDEGRSSLDAESWYADEKQLIDLYGNEGQGIWPGAGRTVM